jgi:hypothetical protein
MIHTTGNVMKTFSLFLYFIQVCAATTILSSDDKSAGSSMEFDDTRRIIPADASTELVACNFEANGDIYVTVNGRKRDQEILKPDWHGKVLSTIHMTEDGQIYRKDDDGNISLIAKPHKPGVGPYRFIVTKSARLKLLDSTDTELWSHPPYKEVVYTRESNVPFIYNGETYKWDEKINVRIDKSGNLLASTYPNLDTYEIVKSTLTRDIIDERLLVIDNPFGHKLYNSHGLEMWNVDDMLSLIHYETRLTSWDADNLNVHHTYKKSLNYMHDALGPMNIPEYKYRAKSLGDIMVYRDNIVDVKGKQAILSSMTEAIQSKDRATGKHELKMPGSFGGSVWIDSNKALSSEDLNSCLSKLMEYITKMPHFYSTVTVWYKRECHIGYKLDVPGSIFE